MRAVRQTKTTVFMTTIRISIELCFDVILTLISMYLLLFEYMIKLSNIIATKTSYSWFFGYLASDWLSQQEKSDY